MDSAGITQHLTRVRPIQEHPAYAPALEYSDKLIVPASLFVALCRARTPSPPLFQVTSLRHQARSTVCGVLAFTAEEDTVYCPAEVLQVLGCYSASHIKGGLSLTSLQRPLPRLQTLGLHLTAYAEVAGFHEALLQYTVLRTGDNKQLWVNGKVVRVTVSHLEPGSACVVIDSGFQLFTEVHKPSLPRTQTQWPQRETKRLRLKTPRTLRSKRLSVTQGKHMPPLTVKGSSEVISFRVSVKQLRKKFISPKLFRFKGI